MDFSNSKDDFLQGDHKSKTTEITASSSQRIIDLSFPTFATQLSNKLRRLSVKIDHCEIKYMPQIPMNSTGTVRVFIDDTRLSPSDQRQAEFCFPVTCQVTLHYYGNSYTSANEKRCPWLCKYQLENSNINSDVIFCKIKAYLKLSTEKHPEQLPFRPPSVTVHSKQFDLKHVDFWHVNHAEVQPTLCRSVSSIQLPRQDFDALKPGQSNQQKRLSVSENRPVPHRPLSIACPPTRQEPTSETTAAPNDTNKAPIHLETDKLANLLVHTVSTAIESCSSSKKGNISHKSLT